MMLAPGCRLMMSSTAGLPLAEPALRRSCTDRRRWPTSAEPHRRAVAVGDDQRQVVGGLEQLVVGVDLPVARRRPRRVPFGRLALAPASAVRTSSRPMPYLSSALRIELDAHRRQRAAADVTWPTPSTCESFCARIVDAASYIWPLRQRVGGEREDHDRRVGRIDLAVGRVARQVRRQLAARRVDRRLHVARGAVDVAVEVELQRDRASSPSELVEVISVTPAMRPSARSSGVATVAPSSPGSRRAAPR